MISILMLLEYPLLSVRDRESRRHKHFSQSLWFIFTLYYRTSGFLNSEKSLSRLRWYVRCTLPSASGSVKNIVIVSDRLLTKDHMTLRDDARSCGWYDSWEWWHKISWFSFLPIIIKWAEGNINLCCCVMSILWAYSWSAKIMNNIVMGLALWRDVSNNMGRGIDHPLREIWSRISRL